jgi:aldehyde dehydrogenase (NAD+)
MKQYRQFYINGERVDPDSGEVNDVVNPATDQVCLRVASANRTDIDRALEAAHRAFPKWSATPAAERRDLLLAAADEMEPRKEDFPATAVDGAKPALMNTWRPRLLSVDRE